MRRCLWFSGSTSLAMYTDNKSYSLEVDSLERNGINSRAASDISGTKAIISLISSISVHYRRRGRKQKETKSRTACEEFSATSHYSIQISFQNPLQLLSIIYILMAEGSHILLHTARTIEKLLRNIIRNRALCANAHRVDRKDCRWTCRATNLTTLKSLTVSLPWKIRRKRNNSNRRINGQIDTRGQTDR